MPRCIALDVGTKTIGIARCDLAMDHVFPVTTLVRKGVRVDVATLVRDHLEGVVCVVVGMPYELDGTEGRSARLARQVGDALGQAAPVTVVYHDERYSTVEAQARLSAAGRSHRDGRPVIDQAAACVILEDWLAAGRPGLGPT